MSDILNIPEIFGCDVFNEATMKQRLAPEIYVSWKQCIATGTSLTLEVANEIAEAVGADVVQVIGTRFVLYRESVDHKKIDLSLIK